MRSFIPGLLLLLVPSAARAGCTVDQLDEAIENAETAFSELRVDDFEVSIEQIDLMLACLEGPVSSVAAARLHRIQGIVRFAQGDDDRAQASLTAARRLDPGNPIPDSLVPPTHPVRLMYDNVDLESDPKMEVPEPKVGWLAFDGERGVERPLERSSVIQVFNAEGMPVTARYSFPGDPMPPYPGVRATMSADMLEQPIDKPKKGKVSPLLVVGGAFVAAGAGSLFAAQAQDAAMDEAQTLEDLDAAYGRQKTFGFTGYGLVGAGALGVVLGVAL